MADLSINRTCTACGKGYRVELRTMRLNLRNICPDCGFSNTISEDQAIKAHRLLERLEYEGRSSNAA